MPPAPAAARRQVLGLVERALDQSAAVLHDRPAECFPQLYARLRADAAGTPGLAAALEAGRRAFPRPWLRVLNWRPQPLLRTFAGHASSINTCTFCLGGARIVSGSLDETVRVWDTATGRELAAFAGSSWGSLITIAPGGDEFAFPDKMRGLVLASATDGRQLAILHFHDSNFNRCRSSPDGRWLLTRGWRDGRIAVWDVAARALRESMYVDDSDDAIFVPGGCRVLLATQYGLRLWDLDTGETDYSFAPAAAPGAAERVGADSSSTRPVGLWPSPDYALVASKLDKRTIVVWDLASREVVARQEHPAPITDLAFLADSRRMVSFAGAAAGPIMAVSPFDPRLALFPAQSREELAAGPVLVWDARTGETLARIELDRVERMLPDPDGRLLLLHQRDNAVSLWDLATGEKRADLVGHRSGVSARVFDRDGRRLFTAGDATVRMWDTATGACLAVFAAHAGTVGHCALDPAGHLLVSGGSDGTLKLWDVSGGAAWLPAAHTAAVLSVATAPGGRAVATSEDGTVSWWDAAAGRMERRSGEDGGRGVRASAVSPDGELAATGGAGGELLISSMRTGEVVRRICEYSDSVEACTFSPDGTLVAWQDMGSGKFVARATGETPLTIIPGAATRAVRFLPPGHRIVTVTNQHGGNPYDFGHLIPTHPAVLLFDAATGDRRAVWDSPDEGLRDAACSPDGRFVATAADRVVRVWSVATGKAVAELAHPEGEVHSCAFSPDGRWLVAAGAGPVRIWKTRGWREHGVLAITCASPPAFLPDGSCLLTAASGALVVWDVRDLRAVTTLTGLTGSISAAAVAPDGRWMIFGTIQGDVLVAAVDGLKQAPAVTAAERAGRLEVRCPACGCTAGVEDDAPDHAWRCPSCSARARINSFVPGRAGARDGAGVEAGAAGRVASGPSRGARKVAAAPAAAEALPAPVDAAGGPAAAPSHAVSVSSLTHQGANPERAFRLNVEYQQALARWRVLPWWRRLRAKKPVPPTGI